MTENNRPTREVRLRRLRRRRHLRRAGKAGAWSLLGLSVLGILAGLAVVLIIDQTLRAPQWLRDRVETRIEANLGGLQISFGDVELVISEGWRPRAALRDVQLSDADGRPILSLSDAEASLAMRPLLRGQVQPKEIALSGAFAVLRRDADGLFSLAFDGSGPAVGRARGLPALIEQLDRIFVVPQLSALVDVTLRQVNLRYEDAVSGQAWTVDGGILRMTRDEDQLRIAGNLALLTGREYASSVEVNYSSVIGQTAATVGLTLTDVPARDIAGQSVALSWLEPLRAPLSGALRGGVNEDGTLAPLNATLQIGQGVLQPNDQTRPIPFDDARAYFTYNPVEQALSFDEISVTSDWVTGNAEGRTFLQVAGDGSLSGLIGQLTLTRTRLNPAGAYLEPISLEGAAADFKLELDPFTLTVGQLFIADQGNELHLNGALRATQAGWDVAMDGQMDALTPERLVALWPEAAIPNTRRWISENLSGGRLNDLNIALRIQPKTSPNIYLDFDYSNAQVQFMRTMPPIRRAAGHASLIDNRFVVTATQGRVVADDGGAVDVSGTSFIVPDTSIKKAAPAVVRLQGRGTITSVLSLLNREPLRILEKPGLPVTLADGTAVFQGNIALPLKDRVQFEEISFFVDAQVRDVSSTVLIPGQRLAAPTLSIQARPAGVEITGAGLLSDLPFLANWRQAFGVPGAGSTLNGKIELSERALETFNIALAPGAVSGTGEAEFAVNLPQGGPPSVELTSDLEGLRLSIPELGWSKSPDTRGSLTLSAELSKPARVPAFDLRAPGFRATGALSASEDGGLAMAEFSTVERGNWMNLRARLEGQGPGVAPSIRILGGTLDLRSAEFGTSQGRGAAPPGNNALIASLDRLQVTDTIALTGFQGQFALRGGLAGNFQGQINGRTRVTGGVQPENGRSAVRVVSQDAGGVLRDAGLLRQAYEGSFDMTLRPVGEPGNFDGTLAVGDTYVRDAPAIAALLNAVSIVGLLSELAGQGIFFREVAARFRLSPSRITLYESRATGPSMGLSMDGVYDVPSQQLNMQGVISPVYLLNQIGGLFAPRRGEGLFGFTYTLTGAVQAPQVAVNPLSGLAPGVLREIFRVETPTPTGDPEDTQVAPEAAPPPQEMGGNR